MAHDDDLDFASMMADAGVSRLGAKGKRPSAAPPPTAARAQHASPAAQAAPAGPPPPDPRLLELEAEVLRAREAALTLEKRLADRDARLATLTAELAERDARAADHRREVDGLNLRKKAAEAERERLAARLREAQTERRGVAPAVDDETAASAAPLAEILAGRGLVGPSEQARAVAALASSESAASFLKLLVALDDADAARFLTTRLALLCGDSACKPPQGATVLRVEPARCDICGGSDIRRAAHDFAAACLAAGVERLRVVGGSPSYRAQLEELFPRKGALQLICMTGTTRVPLHRAKGHQRKDDLVILWGATELDHATSDAYRPTDGWVLPIPHRGIGGMLTQAAELIARGRPQ